MKNSFVFIPHIYLFISLFFIFFVYIPRLCSYIFYLNITFPTGFVSEFPRIECIVKYNKNRKTVLYDSI